MSRISSYLGTAGQGTKKGALIGNGAILEDMELEEQSSALSKQHDPNAGTYFEDEPWHDEYERIHDEEERAGVKLEAVENQLIEAEEKLLLISDEFRWYEVKHTCGHTGRVHSTPTTRERFVSVAEKRLCKLCRYMLYPDVTKSEEGVLGRLAVHTGVHSNTSDGWFTFDEFVLDDNRAANRVELENLTVHGLVECRGGESDIGYKVTEQGWHFLQIENPIQNDS